MLLSISDRRSVEIVGALILTGGGLLWAFGTPWFGTASGNHIGASGLVYGLAAYLVMAGITQKRILPLIVCMITTFFYCGLIWGVLPTQPGVSWDGHLFGAIGGILVAYGMPDSQPENDEDEISPEYDVRLKKKGNV